MSDSDICKYLAPRINSDTKGKRSGQAGRVAVQSGWIVLLRWLMVVTGCFTCPVSGAGEDSIRWEAVVRAYAAEDVKARPPPNAIVFTGSSSIVRWKTLTEDMAPLAVINRGFGGSTMEDAVYWIDALVLKYRPRVVVIYAGDNDIAAYKVTPDELLDRFIMFVSRIHSELPETKIIFLAIKPSILRRSVWPEMRRANDLIRSFCETRGELHFVDVASPMLNEQGQPRSEIFELDGLHMNANGYGIWVAVLKPILLKLERNYDAVTSTDRTVDPVH